ncbi:hypothetical protein LSH36_812g00039 [Paralvinella palmiformis]|uniref:Uncharacterized protein n=1 Tax=Paralvinella palmiformis TaxID=53620 RepID=A0AAD9MS64_9ANNE|nr:hypothetical protein LSH36_812g00039 [Paralvinella palmiformis]
MTPDSKAPDIDDIEANDEGFEGTPQEDTHTLPLLKLVDVKGLLLTDSQAYKIIHLWQNLDDLDKTKNHLYQAPPGGATRCSQRKKNVYPGVESTTRYLFYFTESSLTTAAHQLNGLTGLSG